MEYGRQGPSLTVPPLVKYLTVCHECINIQVGGEEWKNEVEFVSSVAGIADNQVQN